DLSVPVVEDLDSPCGRTHEENLDDTAAGHLGRIHLRRGEEHAGVPAERRENLFARQLERAVLPPRDRLRRVKRSARSLFGIACGVEDTLAILCGNTIDLFAPASPMFR